jgi:hypothetical protein
MAISEPDIKRLWGKAAGRCSHPTCGVDCLPFLDLDYPTILGEMAHVIARSGDGPRGGLASKDDSYSNLILLCPTHHTLVDKAPEGNFTVEMLLGWKTDHERGIEASLTAAVFNDRAQLDDFIRTKLIENRTCWSTYGPESDTAKKNPNSTAAFFWPFRKLSLIVPNNRKLISAIRSNHELFDSDEYRIACEFIEHAEGFERNCTTATENVPTFPAGFGEMFDDEL